MTRSTEFRALHVPGAPLLLPNPWDAGSAVLLAGLGFRALATTSSGHATSLGRHDGQVSRDEALAGAAAIVGATALPVSADLEGGFGATEQAVAETFRRAAQLGLAGASIEDSTGDPAAPLRDPDAAAARVRAAADAAHAVDPDFVVTARAEGFLHGADDIGDVVARLQAYERAGADAVYAPGLTRAADIHTVVTSVRLPVNVLLRPTGPSVAELADLGVARVSIGGALAFAAYGAAADAATALRDGDPQALFALAARGHAATAAFGR